MTAYETWLPVVGYEESYEVSDRGRVRSIDRNVRRKDGHVARYRGRILKLHPDEFGYLEAVLSRGSKGKTFGVHFLQCAAFHGPKPTPDHCARHLDGQQLNNTPDNVVWGTRSENMQDKARHGTNYWLNQTHCVHGHEFTPENTRYERGGKKRCCRQCGRDKAARQRAAKGFAA